MNYPTEATEVEKILIKKANKFKVPITVNFELTPLCNLNCKMCYIHMSKSEIKNYGGLLEFEEWLKIAETLKKEGTLFILLTGGEPLLYPHFKELYIALRQMGFIITVNTNATLVTEEIASLFGKLKPRRVNVTLYGYSEKTYHELCGNALGFKRTLHGIDLLKKNKVDIKLNASIVKDNLIDYKSLLSYAKEQDIPLEVNSYMFPCVRTACHLSRNIMKERLLPQEAALAEIDYLKYKKNADYTIYKKEFKQWLQYGTADSSPLGLDCRAGKSSCWINWQGRMSPCVAMEEPYISLRGKSVNEAWKFIVEQCQLLEKYSECSGCKLRTICNVCYAAACHEKKALGNLSHLCEMAQWKKKYLLDD